MSGGHSRSSGDLSKSELDDLLEEVLSNPKVRRALARPYTVNRNYDIALLGSSSIGWKTVYIDRHLPRVIPIGGKKINVIPPLVRHERLEPIIENLYGWKYIIAHQIATHWEEQLVPDPDKYEKALDPYIKNDETGKLKRVPTDLDLRPAMSGTDEDDKAILAQIKKVANNEKRTHASVGYVSKSNKANQACGLCRMFVEARFGGPGCTGVKDKINAGGWCRRFKLGSLEKS